MKQPKSAVLAALILAALMLVLALVAPARADDDVTVEPVLLVGGVEVTAENQNDILQDGGKATYDPTTGTLTFNNPTFDAGIGSAIYAQNLDLVINGDVNATGTSFGIYVENGTLSINSGNVHAEGEIAIRSRNIVIDGGTTTAVNKPSSQQRVVTVYADNNITINDGEIMATANGSNCYAMYANNEVNVLAGKVTANATGTSNYDDGCAIFSRNALNIAGGEVGVFVTAPSTALSNAYGLWSFDTINISGGTVKVESNCDNNARAIDGNVSISGGDTTVIANGYYTYGFCEGSFTLIDGKVQVTSIGTEDCDGISSWSVNISGGELIAYCKSKNSSAINTQDSVLISGGKVTATAEGESADGISCWQFGGVGGQITISGGEVNATASGNKSIATFTNKPITISGGKVVSKGSNYGLYSEGAMTIGNGIQSIDADGSEHAVFTGAQILLGDELTIKKPQGGKLNDEANTIVNSGGNVSKSVQIVNEHKYTITVSKSDHGTVTSNRTKANDGDVVALTVSPDKGCLLTSIIATDANDQEVGLTATDDGYTFNMPESNVTVTATFDYDWSDPSYEWAADHSTVTATRVCKEDDTVVETETVEAIAQVTKPATCTQKGETTYTSVEFANEAFVAQQTTVQNIDATGHDWGEWTITKKATIPEEGLKTRICNNDSSHVETESIPKIDPNKGVFLARMTAEYNTRFVLTWSKLEGAEGYDIFFVRCTNDFGKKVKTIKGNKRFAWTKTGLSKQTAYKAVVKAYVTIDGKKTYVRTSPAVHAYTSGGTKAYTNAQSVKVKKTTVSLKVGKTHTIKASLVKVQPYKKLMPSGHGPKLRYVSSNKKVAKVSKSGVITAKSKGSCKVYVIAINGVCRAIDVTVR